MLLRRLILPLCYLVFACKSVPQPSIEKIINGHMVAELPAKQQEKYKSVIPIKSPQGRICTGIVVAPKTMMTAAHCVLNVNEEVAPVSVLSSIAILAIVCGLTQQTEQNLIWPSFFLRKILPQRSV